MNLRDAVAEDEFALRLEECRMSTGTASVVGSSIKSKAITMERSPNLNSASVAG